MKTMRTVTPLGARFTFWFNAEGQPVQRGAHLLFQTRTRALDGTLRPLFERWHPGLANDNAEQAIQAAA
jgi:hypothetical protein